MTIAVAAGLPTVAASPRWRQAARLACGATALVMIVLVIVVAAVLRPYPRQRLHGGPGLVITDRHGEPLRVVPGTEGARGRFVTLDRVPPELVLAMLAGEDRRFYAHPGVDLRAIGRAVASVLRQGRVVSGASTITMQLARTLEPRPRSLSGKLREMIDALRIERAIDKKAILEQYLNRIYFGGGAWGIEAAAQRRFGKSVAALGAGEATLLATLPRAPNGYDLDRHLPRALLRRQYLLSAMVSLGWITPAALRRVEAEPVVPRGAPLRWPSEAPHFVDAVLRRVRGGAPHEIPSASVSATRASISATRASISATRGSIATTLDLTWQRDLERSVRNHVTDLRAATGARIEAGVVALDPSSGAVRAMVGSFDHAASSAGQVNITTEPRHPGSTLKPFVYGLAIEAGASPATIARDERAAVPIRHGPTVVERGPVRYREALAGSFNLAAMDVTAKLGVAPVLETLRRAGLGPLPGTASSYGLPLALGSARVRLVDLAAAYGAFVNRGLVVAARYTEDDPIVETRIFSPAASHLVMDMLADPAARRAAFGAHLPLDLPFPVAAKTGTSSGFADTISVIATREIVVAAWTGSFDGSGTRGRLAMWSAAPLARTAIWQLSERLGRPLTLPSAPGGLVAREVCRLTGESPSATCPRKRELLLAAQPESPICAGH